MERRLCQSLLKLFQRRNVAISHMRCHCRAYSSHMRNMTSRNKQLFHGTNGYPFNFRLSKLLLPELWEISRTSPCRRNASTISLSTGVLKDYLQYLEDEHHDLTEHLMSGEAQTERDSHKLNRRLVELHPLVSRMKIYNEKKQEIKELESLLSSLKGTREDDREMREMATSDLKALNDEISGVEEEILGLVVTEERVDQSDVILEIKHGVGGQEAMLFTGDLFDMYERYAAYKGWQFDVIEHDSSDMGGLRKASVSVSGRDVYKHLKYECGVHRVQRVPKTEKSGRVHTSTVAVAVLPQPSEIDVQINSKDLRMDFFRASGAGGQHINKTDSAVRVVHLPTGIVTECQTTRSQLKNKEKAMQILRSKLYQRELDAQLKQLKSQRKLQVGSSARSEKIRTYNFNQDRVTDHRLGKNLHNLDGFLAGGEGLDDLNTLIQEEAAREKLQETLQNFMNNSS